MARVVFRKRKSRSGLWTAIFAIVAFAALMLIWWVAGSIQHSHDDEELEVISNAVIRATVQCYSLESRYPPSLEYLEENYGLSIDRSEYVIHYRVIGQNIMPDVRLFKLEK